MKITSIIRGADLEDEEDQEGDVVDLRGDLILESEGADLDVGNLGLEGEGVNLEGAGGLGEGEVILGDVREGEAILLEDVGIKGEGTRQILTTMN